MKQTLKFLFLFMLCLPVARTGTSQTVEFGSEQITKAYNNQPMLLGVKNGNLYVIRVTGYKANIYMSLMRSDGKAAAGALLLGVARFTNDAPFNEERLFYTQNSRYFFEKYDKDMKLITSQELDVEVKPKGDLYDFLKFAMIGDKIYAFTYEFDEKSEENSVDAHEISDEGVFQKESVKVASYTTKNKYNTGRKDHSYKVLSAPDHSRFLVMHSELEFAKGSAGDKTLSLEMFDNELKSLWKEDLVIPLNEKTVTLEKVKLSDAGDVAALFKIKNESDEKDAPTHIYGLYTYFAARKKLDVFSLKMGDKFTNDISFEFEGKGTLEVAGFYSGKNKSSAEGFFYRKINTQTGEVDKDAEEGFTKEFITTAVGAKKADDTESLRNFHMRKVIPLSDGRTALLAEKYYITYSNNNSGMVAMAGGGGSYEYNYEDIYVIMLDKDGNYEWGKKILKFQRTFNDGGLYNSFSSVSNKDNIILIYNANRDDPDDRMTNTQKATVYCTLVPLDGAKPTTKKLFNAREAETIMVPKIFLQETEESLLFYNISSKYYKYARVKV